MMLRSFGFTLMYFFLMGNWACQSDALSSASTPSIAWHTPPRWTGSIIQQRDSFFILQDNDLFYHGIRLPQGDTLFRLKGEDSTFAWLPYAHLSFLDNPTAELSPYLLIYISKDDMEGGGYVSRYFFLDKHGRVAIRRVFEQVRNFSEGLALVERDNLYGFIDPKGEWGIQPSFRNATSFSQGMAAVAVLDDRFYNLPDLVDIEEDTLTEAERYPLLWGYMLPSGEWAIRPQFLAAEPFGDGLAWVLQSNGYWAVINRQGKTIFTTDLEAEDYPGDPFQGGFSVRHRRFFVDQQGQERWKDKYEAVRNFSQGLAAVRNQEYKWGFMDTTGTLVIGCVYEDVSDFEDGISCVSQAGRYGYINRLGEMIYPFVFSNAYPPHKGKAFASPLDTPLMGILQFPPPPPIKR